MGIEIELGILIIIQLLASSFFGHFEVGTPAWRKIVKWLVLDSITVALYFGIGHYALIFPLAIAILGTTVHIRICKKNGIDPLKATPRDKYYKLRGWKLEE
ncbi:MAG: hypothetical protein KBC67_00535 [Candidatus Pacebacteria bacterium]|nr:hypothetical protein [Candidatus Paceibacterota bacterium]